MRNHHRASLATAFCGARVVLLAALCLLACTSQPASAQTIVYTDPADMHYHLGTASDSISPGLSLDGSGGFDVFFPMSVGSNFRSLAAAVSSPGRIVTTSSVVTPLLSGATIGPTLAAGQSFGLGGSFMRSAINSPDDFGPWPENEDRYIGVKMVRQPSPFETNVYYGWVRVSISMTSTSTDLTIKDWAYNSERDAPITAGDTGITALPEPSTVPEPGSLVMFSAACCSLLAVRRGRKTQGRIES